MKTLIKTLSLALLLTFSVGTASVQAQDWTKIFGSGSGSGSNSGSNGGSNTLGNILEGVFSRSNLSLADIVGTYVSNGPAVAFQSEGLLKQAGGIAAAGALESELAPYYEKYGLNGATVSIDSDGQFAIKLKLLTLKGTVSQKGEANGVFQFNFQVLGMSLGSLTTYVQKTSSTMNLMFDATKLKQLVSQVAKLTNISIAKTFSTLLDQYEGLCVGFRLEGTGNTNTNSGLGSIFGGSKGNSSNSGNSGNSGTSKGSGSSNGSANSGNSGNGIDQLLDILGGKSKSGSKK